MSEPAGHSLLLPFDTNDAVFARGFETGRLWALLQERPDEEIVELAHGANAEMLIRLAEATGRTVSAEILDDTWVEATFGISDRVDSPA